MMKKLLLPFTFATALPLTSSAQEIAVKTNLLYWATTTINFGAEASVATKQTIQLFYSINSWTFPNEKKAKHWVLQPEWRYWFCQSFNGWFVGAHLMGGEFNTSNLDLPLGIFPSLEDHRYEGWFIGGGVAGGYQWGISEHWHFEASIGFGYDYIKYDKFRGRRCGKKLKSAHSHYVGPTKAALNLMYLF